MEDLSVEFRSHLKGTPQGIKGMAVGGGGHRS